MAPVEIQYAALKFDIRRRLWRAERRTGRGPLEIAVGEVGTAGHRMIDGAAKIGGAGRDPVRFGIGRQCLGLAAAIESDVAAPGAHLRPPDPPRRDGGSIPPVERTPLGRAP